MADWLGEVVHEQVGFEVARSIYSHLPADGTPLWLGFNDVGNADPATVLAALA